MTKLPSNPLALDVAFSRYQRWSHAAVVLVVTAILDDQLERCLKRAMRPMPRKIYADLFDPMRPLGSFAGKVVMAYALSIISREIYVELEKIRAIRNAFAHSSDVLHLESESIAPLFAKLRKPTPTKATAPESVFLECIPSMTR